MTKTNTDEAYRRYCAEWGMCNRVVFDAAYWMGRSDEAKQIEIMTWNVASLLDDIEDGCVDSGLPGLSGLCREAKGEIRAYYERLKNEQV